MEDDRPEADDARVGRALSLFPYQEMCAAEFAARFAQALPEEALSYDQYQYADTGFGLWIDELCQLLESPAELERCRKRYLGTAAVEFKLLCLGMCQQRAKIVRPLVEPGAFVPAGRPILEVEAEKVTWELICPLDGVLILLQGEGSELVLGQPLVRVEPTKNALFASDPPVGPAWWRIATYLLPSGGLRSCGTWPA